MHADDQLSLSKQQTEKRRKEELLRYKKILAVSEKILMHYIIMRLFILRNVGTLLLRLTGRIKI